MLSLPAIKQQINPTSLLYGFGGAIALYLLILGLIGLQSGSAIKKLEAKLASETIQIERTYVQAPELPKHPVENIQDEAETVKIAPQVQKGKSLSPAPIDGLYEEGKYGLLPIVTPNKLRPYDVYRKPLVTSSNPTIAIAVLDFGLNVELSKQALSTLPSEVSFVISPYADAPSKFQKEARINGHELWMNLPMQTIEFPLNDPGPRGLLADAGLSYNQDNLSWNLSRTTGYTGVVAFTDNAFDSYTTIVKNIFNDIFDRGLGYVELNPTESSSVETMALLKDVPYARNNFYMNDVSLKAIENQAREKGYALAVIPPSPNGLQSLQTWLPTLEAKGLTLVPLSTITDRSTRQ